jgi:hypothetical protein
MPSHRVVAFWNCGTEYILRDVESWPDAMRDHRDHAVGFTTARQKDSSHGHKSSGRTPVVQLSLGGRP